MIHLSDRITVADFLDAGACIEGVSKFVAETGRLAGPVSELSGEAKKFFDGDGYGDGDGDGDGDGNGDDDGYGYGDGNGDGDGYGDDE